MPDTKVTIVMDASHLAKSKVAPAYFAGGNFVGTTLPGDEMTVSSTSQVATVCHTRHLQIARKINAHYTE